MVYKGYIGVAVIDSGFDTSSANSEFYDNATDWDFRDGDDDPRYAWGDWHGPTVMGVVETGLEDLQGSAITTGYRVGFGAAGSPAMHAQAITVAATKADVVNLSWGYNRLFEDNFKVGAFLGLNRALRSAVEEGRDGKGAVVVVAGGNGGQTGDDVNAHNMRSALGAIAVAASDAVGRPAAFSTPGAAILVAAPGVDIATTDAPGSWGYSPTDSVVVSGTSYATAAVSGAVAQILASRPDLGWRDVQEILAFTARAGGEFVQWRANGAEDFNGGGLVTSRQLGFGVVDVAAAVRLASAWEDQKTSSNQFSATVSTGVRTTLGDGGATMIPLRLTEALYVEHVTLDLSIAQVARGDLTITLRSPSGFDSLLLDRIGATPSSTTGDTRSGLQFTLMSNEFWGEAAQGDWTLIVANAAGGPNGLFQSATLTAHGDAHGEARRLVYTDAFADLGAQGDRSVIAGGDAPLTVMAAAMSLVIDFDLDTGGFIAGRSISVAPDAQIVSFVAGDGDDRLLAGVRSSRLVGGAGEDRLEGGAGADTLSGGAGDDLLVGGADDVAVWAGDVDDFSIRREHGTVFVEDLTGREGVDRLIGIDRLRFADVELIAPSDQENQHAALGIGQDSEIEFSQEDFRPVLSGVSGAHDGATIGFGAQGVTAAPLGSGRIAKIEVTDTDGGDVHAAGVDAVWIRLGGGEGDRVTLVGVQRATMDLGDGDDRIVIEAHAGDGRTGILANRFTVSAGAGDDWMSFQSATSNSNLHAFGGDGDDIIEGGRARDRIEGGRGDDRMTGGDDRDLFVFRNGDGLDAITDFVVGIDKLRMEGGIERGEVSWIAEHGGVAVHYGGGDAIFLEAVAIDAMSHAAFHFV